MQVRSVIAHVSARAAGPDFGYVYTTGIEEEGETELSLWATDRRGKGQCGAGNEIGLQTHNRFPLYFWQDNRRATGRVKALALRRFGQPSAAIWRQGSLL